MLGVARLGGDEGCVHVGHVGAAVPVAAVRPQLTHQLAVHRRPARHGHGHPHGGAGGDVLERPAVAPVVLVAQVGAARVVAGPRTAVLRGRLLALAAHRLGVAVGGLVAAAHPLPLPQAGVDLSEGGPLVGQLVPALHHEGVHPAGAVLGAGQQLAGPDHLYDLLVAVAVVRLQ